MPPQVILITGQYGTSHKAVGKALCDRANIDPRLIGARTGRAVAKYYSIDDYAWRLANGSDVFFKEPTDEIRDAIWNRAADEVRSEIEADHDSPTFAIVSAHVVYFSENRFFSCVDWDRILLLQPRAILTLIDDIYDIQRRVTIQEAERGTTIAGGSYELRDILQWRLHETHTANLLAKHLTVKPDLFPSIAQALASSAGSLDAQLRRELGAVFHSPCEHYVISVKQGTEDFFKLLFRRDLLRVYASFPISAPRRKQDMAYFEQLHAWRKELHEHFMVFDPLGIDELRFQEDDSGGSRGSAARRQRPNSWTVSSDATSISTLVSL